MKAIIDADECTVSTDEFTGSTGEFTESIDVYSESADKELTYFFSLRSGYYNGNQVINK